MTVKESGDLIMRKKMICVLTALCMTITGMNVFASAALDEVSAVPEPMESVVGSVLEPIDGTFHVVDITDSSEIDVTDGCKAENIVDGNPTASPYIIVAEGAKAFIKKISVYPAYIDPYTHEPIAYDGVVNVEAFEDCSQSKISFLTAAETSALIEKFVSMADKAPNAWLFVTEIHVYPDYKGSYGEYFMYKPRGTSIAMPNDQYTKVEIDKVTSPQAYEVYNYYAMPENTTEKYSIGLAGEFYYYNAGTKRHQHTMSGTLASFNVN